MFSLTFAEGTYGIEGKEVDYHAVYPEIGPMAGKGFTRYTTLEDIEKLYKLKNNKITNIGREDRYLNINKPNQVIQEWVIELKKI